MMVEPAPVLPTNSFIIHFWKEYSTSENVWRGWIKHIQSGQRMAFKDAEGAMGFMRSFGIFCDEEDLSETMSQAKG